jgi:hypothetical protein
LIGSSVGRVIVIVVWSVVIVTIRVTAIVITVIIIVRVTVVIVRVTVIVGVIRIVIPWVKPPPQAADKDKHAVVMKVGAMPVPIAMPVGVMPLGRVVSNEFSISRSGKP